MYLICIDLLNTLQHPGIWHKCNGGGGGGVLHSGLAALAGHNESLETVQSQHGLWCCQDGSSPLPFTQTLSFCIALCDSAGCQSICCCFLCRCQLSC